MSENTISILEGNTFVVSDRRGNIDASPSEPTGLFSWDTRFLSRWMLTLDGKQLAILSTDELEAPGGKAGNDHRAISSRLGAGPACR